MSLVRRSNMFDPFSLDLWGPFDNMFRSIVPASSDTDTDTAAFANARIDWKETPEAHVFKADLPGVKKEEVKVEVENGNVLVISGQRAKEKEEKNDKWHRVERSSGQFLRRFRLPENAKVDQVKAGLENGVLTVTVPKARGQEAGGEGHRDLWLSPCDSWKYDEARLHCGGGGVRSMDVLR